MRIIGIRLDREKETIILPRQAQEIGIDTKSENLIQSRIISKIRDNEGDDFILTFQDPNSGRVGRRPSLQRPFGPNYLQTTITDNKSEINLAGQTIDIVNSNSQAIFELDGTITVVQKQIEGALPRQSTVKQLDRIRKATKSTTIDDRIPKLKGANLGYEGNTIDRGIESFEDFEKKNKSFIPGWNLKHLKSPFRKSDSKNLNQ